MKATTKQKEICDFIISQAKFWRDSNDLYSPTHGCDIDEELYLLDLTEEQNDSLRVPLEDLLYAIRMIKE